MNRRNTSLRLDVAMWFLLHADDELTAADAALKFGADRSLCYSVFASLARDSFLELVPEAWPRTYRVGPRIKRLLEEAGRMGADAR